MSKTLTLRIDDDDYQLFRTFAKAENRSLSNFIATAAGRYIEEHELTDYDETESIINNKELLEKLKKGHRQRGLKKANF